MKSRAKTNRVLPRECSGHSKEPRPTTPEMMENMDLTRWSIPKSDGLLLFFVVKDGEVLYSQQKQDQELTVARITNSLLQKIQI